MPMYTNREKELQLRRTLLIADDSEINGDILALHFENDFNILRAYNGQETLDIIKENIDTIDLVLLDIFMPVLDGFSVLKARKEDPEIRKIPFIVMTGEPDIEKDCFHLGVNDFINKGRDDPEIIVARVKRMIELYEDRSIIKEVKTDALTGLYSLEFFKKFANQFDKAEPKVDKDLLSVNITRFHLINELYGREYGEEVLKNIADYLSEYLKDIKGIASHTTEGDFLIYCSHQEDYSPFLDGLMSHLHDSVNSESVRIHVGVYPNVDESLDKEIVIGRALNVSQNIKDDSQIYGVYDEKTQEKAFFEEQLINSFDKAIKEKQFKIFYQPKYNIQGERNKLVSAEALIRWIHPKYGMVSPGVFIPLFEHNGYIRKLDNYVFNEVARQQAEWNEQYGFYLPVSVNVSRVDIHNPNLVKEILEAVDKHNVPRDKYYIEITESAYAQDEHEVVSVATELKENGLLIEVDDFGSGYSSLNTISDLPFDVLKIDMLFMRRVDNNPKTKEIIKMILAMCKQFNATSVAEGVETDEHYKFLKESGCDVIQGYYFSKPLPNNEFIALIEKEINHDR